MQQKLYDEEEATILHVVLLSNGNCFQMCQMTPSFRAQVVLVEGGDLPDILGGNDGMRWHDFWSKITDLEEEYIHQVRRFQAFVFVILWTPFIFLWSVGPSRRWMLEDPSWRCQIPRLLGLLGCFAMLSYQSKKGRDWEAEYKHLCESANFRFRNTMVTFGTKKSGKSWVWFLCVQPAKSLGLNL